MEIGYKLKLKLKRSVRARTMRLVVYPDARVVVTAPTFFGMRAIERFVVKHSAWVRRKVEETRDRRVIHIKRSEIAVLKKLALESASARCAHFAKIYDVHYRKISIRAQKSRWGSCSRTGNLSFNYRIAALPLHIADYIIVHELCHLAEMNHSKDFWRLVEQTMPDHRGIRKELKNTTFIYPSTLKVLR